MAMQTRLTVTVLGAMLCLASFGLGGSPARALSSGHDGPEFVYNSKEAIGEAQGILQHLGLLKAGSYQRGTMDDATRGALQSFQRTHTLRPTGQVDGETLAELLQHRPAADSDGDGVPDAQDRCPGTPQGAKVDSRGCPTDSDGDGVPNDQDRCPDTPRGTKVNSDGCPADADGDGVPDDRDRCPDTPRGAKVNSDGCPADADGDGVPDDRDRCPDTPRGSRVDSRGCPEESAPAAAAAPVVTKTPLVLQGVNFETNSARLTADSTPVLDRVAESLKANPDVRVEIAGYTDSTGSHAINRRLSKARADSVRDYLAAHGVAASRMETKGHGPDNPIADNKTTSGRAQNRRVEMKRVD
jgi:OOP family OmpA-OmpF porin